MAGLTLLIGFLMVALLGIAHHYGLVVLDTATADAKRHPQRALISTFVSLLLLHVLEILAFALAYRGLLQWDGIGGLGNKYDGSWTDLIYFSGTTYVTLGYTQLEASGPFRLIVMMQSLGGFMVLTWSATFIYSVWGKARGT